MNDLSAMVRNLSYEIFGVILPGLIAELFFVVWWIALGSAAPILTFGLLPQLTSSTATKLVESLTVNTGIGIAVPGIVVAYFAGHILHWVGRSSTPDEKSSSSWPRRVVYSLIFRIPKPIESYYSNLNPLFEAVEPKFRTNDLQLNWTQFFPLAKCYLSTNLSSSLVATYQNKYTLHRSITTAATFLFWACILAIGLGVVGLKWCPVGEAPRWGLLMILDLFALVLVWGFSDSYLYHWRMFGNTIITETYSQIYGPSNVRPKQ